MVKRKKIQVAQRGWLRAEGATKTEAKRNLEPMVDYACRASALTVERRFDCLVVVTAFAGGWQYQAIPLDMLRHGDQAGCFTHAGQGEDYVKILQSARTHAAQLSWHHGCDDERHVCAAGLDAERSNDLRRWCRFQRAYTVHRAAGLPDGEAHRRACEDSWTIQREEAA